MEYQLTVRCLLEERDENGQYGNSHLAVEEKIVLGSMDLAEVADVLTGFHELGEELKEAQKERDAEKEAARAADPF